MENCIFCKIVKGKIPSFKIYENDYVIVILDINPANKGHLLVIPKAHSEDIFNIGEKDFIEVMKIVRRLSILFSEYDGLNILQNNKEQAGQVVKHFHVHLIPREKSDEGRVLLKWIPIRIDNEEMSKIKLELEQFIKDNKLFN